MIIPRWAERLQPCVRSHLAARATEQMEMGL